MTLLCVPILVVDERSALADAAAARDAGADVVEFRIDELFSGSLDARGNLDDREVRSVLRLVRESPLPCIVTCRAAAESGGVGGYDGDDMARVSLYERLGTAAGSGEHPPRYIDVEYATYVRSANIRHKIDLAVDHPRQKRDVRTGLILSMHDFGGRPRDLLRRVSLIASEPAASVVKVAFAARSIRDNLELFDLLSDARGEKNMIALGMGRFGLMSRVLAPKFGGFLTFASLRAASATAPGQPTVRELRDLYRFESITPRTRVYGLIGWPVEHSLSPLVHNAGFDSLRPEEDGAEAAAFDGVYLPLPVPPEWEHFKATLAELIAHPRLDFFGCSVTVPHKQHLVRFATEAMAASSAGPGTEWRIDELSRLCGAANTLRVERNSDGSPVRAYVTNTDAAAATEALRAVLPDLADQSIAILGAGGAARAAAAGLARAGARVTVAARSFEGAERLVGELRAAAPQLAGLLAPCAMDALTTQAWSAVVNCTPVGMTGGPAPDAMPITPEQVRALPPHTVVFDTVYNPVRTPLLRTAGARGLRTVDGLAMFVRQAAAQFEAWTSRPAPLGLFERICRDELGAAADPGPS